MDVDGGQQNVVVQSGGVGHAASAPTDPAANLGDAIVAKQEQTDDGDDQPPVKKIKIDAGNGMSKLDLDSLKKHYGNRLLEQIIQVVNDNYGGPAQYLQQHLASPEQQSAFADYLKEELPVPAPNSRASPMDADHLVLHSWELGYESRCTSKPLPFPNVTMQIDQEIDKDIDEHH